MRSFLQQLHPGEAALDRRRSALFFFFFGPLTGRYEGDVVAAAGAERRLFEADLVAARPDVEAAAARFVAGGEDLLAQIAALLAFDGEEGAMGRDRRPGDPASCSLSIFAA
jgi:hypothetical protein